MGKSSKPKGVKVLYRLSQIKFFFLKSLEMKAKKGHFFHKRLYYQNNDKIPI